MPAAARRRAAAGAAPAAAGAAAATGARRRRAAAAGRPGPSAPSFAEARADRLVPGRSSTSARPRRPVARPRRRARRPPRQARPVDPRRPRRARSSASGCSASPSRTRCTSTRSTTPGRRRSSSRTGATAISHDIYEWTHPHLAKYAMAGGHRRVGATTRDARRASSACRCRDAVIEPRRDDSGSPGDRGGDRVCVATGNERPRLRPRRRAQPVATLARPGRRGGRRRRRRRIALFIGTDDGAICGPRRDGARRRSTASELGSRRAAEPFGHVDGAITRLATSDDGTPVAASHRRRPARTLDADTAEALGTVVSSTRSPTSPRPAPGRARRDARRGRGSAAAAAVLAALLGGDAATYEARLADVEPDAWSSPGSRRRDQRATSRRRSTTGGSPG